MSGGIVVLRALELGDMLCSVPALRALRQAYPDALISLVGLPDAAAFVQRFSHYVDELLPFPGISAFPEQAADESRLPAFYRAVQARHFDLALQMHGSGQQSNAIVAQFGAQRCAGFVARAEEERPGSHLLWPDDLPEPRRYIALMRHIGLSVGSEALELPFEAEEAGGAAALLEKYGLDPARTVLIHAGARLPSRRWPADRYAQVINALQRAGWQVALTGTAPERDIIAAVQASCRLRVANLCGQTTLGQLAALLSRIRLLICNDTGISHVAAAVGAPSVVIACGSDAARWAPLDHRRHPVLAAQVPCRPCAHRVCPTQHECATAITPRQVLWRAHDALGEAFHG